MSQAWHEHLGNLTWWERIDRFFNPNKYSCTNNFVGADDVWHISLVIMFVCLSAALVCVYLAYRVGRDNR